MSAKKTVSKKAAPVKKAPAKKAPAKKVAEKKAPAKKGAPAKKATEPKKKPAPKKEPAKSASPKKPVKPAKNVPQKGAAPKKGATGKKGDSDKKKVAPAVKPVEKPKKKGKPAPENPPKAGKPSKTGKPEKVSSKHNEAEVVKPAPVADEAPKEQKISKVIKGAVKAAPAPKEEEPEIIISILLDEGQALLKVPFFLEVDEQEDRTNKKKVSSELKGLEKPTLVMRRKASLAEETPEELYNRVIQELEEENQNLFKESENQLCTKCGVRPVLAEYRVDKDLGYCEECAKMLGLGHTKEARRLDYQMNLMGGDSLSEGDDELADAAPTAEDLADPDLDIDDGKDL